MRIAMIGQKGMPAKYGGVERHVHDLSVRLVKFGHEVVVYSRPWYSGRNKQEFEKVKIKLLPSIRTKHLDTISHIFLSTLHALTQNYDIIHYHGVGPSLLSWLPRIFSPHTKVVTTFHSIDRHHQKWNWFAKMILRLGERTACLFAHETITISKSIEHYCLNEFNKQTDYVPNGINLSEKNINQDKLKLFGLESNQYFVMVSRLVAHKGAHTLIEAFRLLKEKYNDNPKINKLKLAIVGGSVYTDNYVKNLHQQASLMNDVIFTDFQTGEILEQLYQHSIALINPSINEGLPITVIQAMGYKKPVILSAIPEHLELTRDITYIFEKEDALDLVQKMYELIILPEAERQEIGEKNKHIVEKFYSWEKLVPQIIEVYKKPIKKQLAKKLETQTVE